MRRHAASIVLATIAGLTSGCQPEHGQPPAVSAGAVMGTTYSVQLFWDQHEVDRASLEAEIRTTLDALNARMSTYRGDSEVSRFNRSRSTDWFSVSADTATVLAEALRISAVSDGAFDVTIGPVVDLWGFGPSARAADPPAHEEVSRTLKITGFERIFVRLAPPSIRKMRPELQVDLSGIAKGYAVDQIAELLQSRGVESYLVEIGGELRAGGTKPDGSAWRIAIETPSPGARDIQQIVPLTDAAIATSGGYRNFFEADGVRYSHTIDPRTGYPIRHELASVSIIAATAMEADALATALLVLGPQDGLELARQESIAALVIQENAQGFRQFATEGFGH